MRRLPRICETCPILKIHTRCCAPIAALLHTSPHHRTELLKKSGMASAVPDSYGFLKDEIAHSNIEDAQPEGREDARLAGVLLNLPIENIHDGTAR